MASTSLEYEQVVLVFLKKPDFLVIYALTVHQVLNTKLSLNKSGVQDFQAVR